MTPKIEDFKLQHRGHFFESELKLLPGTVVFISGAGDSKYYRAEVKWSQKLDRVGAERYGIGAEYIDPP